jgi:hypothetical protein
MGDGSPGSSRLRGVSSWRQAVSVLARPCALVLPCDALLLRDTERPRCCASARLE